MQTDNIAVSPATIPNQQKYGDEVFPRVLECQSSGATLDIAAAWLHAHRDELDTNARQAGAILFRGFPVSTAEDFDRFVVAFNWTNFRYEDSMSNAVRVVKTPRVFTANEAPPDVAILLHHEMAQTPYYPSKLFFFCEQPAETGGATPLCRSDILWAKLASQRPEFAKECQSKGLRYTNVMPGENDFQSGMGRSWQSTLRANTRNEAEERLREMGYDWEWLPDGCLRARTPVLPAVYSIEPGRLSFFNQLIAAYRGWKDARNDPSTAITFGDGSLPDREAVALAVELADQLTFDLPWQRGDVALVDNMVVMHGRRPFTGTRKVLASLVAV